MFDDRAKKLGHRRVRLTVLVPYAGDRTLKKRRARLVREEFQRGVFDKSAIHNNNDDVKTVRRPLPTVGNRQGQTLVYDATVLDSKAVLVLHI